jgi:hypothetical protein
MFVDGVVAVRNHDLQYRGLLHYVVTEVELLRLFFALRSLDAIRGPSSHNGMELWECQHATIGAARRGATIRNAAPLREILEQIALPQEQLFDGVLVLH